MDLFHQPATEQAQLLRRRELSPVELVSLYLERIETHDRELNAFVTVATDQALADARSAERRLRDPAPPPFLGVPVAVKDTVETAGIRTTFSSMSFQRYVPVADAGIARRLRDAGFIVIGKTNTPEFGVRPVTESYLNGICRNPWATTRTAGGSSGGSAAAVAALLSPVAHGSDGGGSIRIPASCCGVVGLKPSRGRLSCGPELGERRGGMTTDGFLTRTVADAAAAVDAVGGYQTGDPYWAPKPEQPFTAEVGRPVEPLRVAISTATFEGETAHYDCVAAVHEAANLLASVGHEVDEAAPDWSGADFFSWHRTLLQVGPALFRAHQLPSVEPLMKELASAAVATSSVEYVRTLKEMHKAARRIIAFWDTYDVLLTPTLPFPPEPVGVLSEVEDPWDQFSRGLTYLPFTLVANMTGQPAISLPLSWNADGLPIGIQLIGRPADEATLIRLSSQIESIHSWSRRVPSGDASALPSDRDPVPGTDRSGDGARPGTTTT